MFIILYRMIKRGIIYFLRYPEHGKTKSRLEAEIGRDLTYELYNCFISDFLATLQSLDTEVLVFVYPENSVRKMSRRIGDRCPVFPQKGANLGARMKNAFKDGFSLNFDYLVLIGADIPDLPGGIIEKSMNIPFGCDTVIGPSADGGYYLIGFRHKAFRASIFSGKTWGSATVLSDTIDNLKSLGLTYHLLPQWFDVDNLEDLKRLFERNHLTPFKGSATIEYMMKNLAKML